MDEATGSNGSHPDVRNPALDGLRGIAVIAVFIAHVLDGVFPLHLPLIPGWPISIGGGVTGVQLFFVLSGYLITSILLREHARTGAISLPAFYVRRFFRIIPPLFRSLLRFWVHFLCYGAFECTREYLTSAHLYSKPSVGCLLGFQTPFGSLIRGVFAVEEQFYLIWPLTLVVLLRRRPQAQLPTLVMLIVAVNVLRFLSETTLSESVLRWDAPLLGAVLAVRPVALPNWILRGSPLAFVALTLWLPQSEYADMYFLVTALVGGAMLCFALSSQALALLPLQYFGRISYQLYLWHLLLMRLPIPTVLIIPLSIAISHLLYNIIDRPSIAAGHRLSNRLLESFSSRPKAR